ncbi:hypothetical protein COV87_04230 [Candidatus Roizmanbacteria bacterium CG11_big_fil_rev_8_21_14_0_20_37_16]|uniref:Uncharacterized protein n=1 Tax=Candidatus Roizmanbacteria bacterium CG11_big_fil_rev_8_21_14_0_20_37_16 TaxID=1974857 RepID=A0A2H0KJ38_9BACT|nr:MAG: hypothetical protein COV87_04230 [Candidatus Roizmanbacteria bacterium CG11_big_fil_rev_8_21_14_0_20_37_16]
MFPFELSKRRGSEELRGKAFLTAPCGEINPTELYFSPEGYKYKCRACGGKATYKMLFLSPKYEVEGFLDRYIFSKTIYLILIWLSPLQIITEFYMENKPPY